MPQKELRAMFGVYRPKFRDLLIERKSPAPDNGDASDIPFFMDEEDFESATILWENELDEEAELAIRALRYDCHICGKPWGH